jgi:hypothetical protein
MQEQRKEDGSVNVGGSSKESALKATSSAELAAAVSSSKVVEIPERLFQSLNKHHFPFISRDWFFDLILSPHVILIRLSQRSTDLL